MYLRLPTIFTNLFFGEESESEDEDDEDDDEDEDEDDEDDELLAVRLRASFLKERKTL
jgi:hypothetical protein